MTARLTDTGYWHVRLGAERFAQWPAGTQPTDEHFFPRGWWTQREMDQARELAGKLDQETT